MELKSSHVRLTLLVVSAIASIYLCLMQDGFDQPLDDAQKTMTLFVTVEQFLKSKLEDEEKEAECQNNEKNNMKDKDD